MSHHPNVHAPAKDWSEDQVLHVAACYSNPYRWRTRRELANDFRRHMGHSPNVVLHFVELAYGDRPFEVTGDHPGDLQLRADCELFHKENLLNLAVRTFPAGWKYGAVIDADFHFARHDWALEAVHQLQHHPWVQLFSSYTDLSGHDRGHGHRPIGTNSGFAFNYVQNGYRLPAGYADGGWVCSYGSYDEVKTGGTGVGATGGAWAFTRRGFDAVGGLMDRCILGHADWFMAFGLVGAMAPDMHHGGYSSGYRHFIAEWQRRAVAASGKNIGYVDGHAIHHFHGPKGKRGYSTRDLILVENGYDPYRDVFPDWQGVLQLTGEKNRLRDDIRSYFLSRSEDIPHPHP